jgi:predicted ATPase
LLASFVDIPVAPERRPSLTRDEFRQKQSSAMAAWALAAARAQPLVLLLEDLQWFDPTSIDLIRGLSERGVAAPLLVVATARPEFRPSWSLRSHHSVISLTPLGAGEVQRMIAELASQQSLSPDLIDRVSDRAGGIPLFVEEVTRLLLESGGQGLPQSIPPTLRQSLAARLDRLGSAREIAQIGAVLGRDFSYALLRDVACPALGDRAAAPHEWAAETGATKLDEAALGSALHVLVAADLLTKDGSHPASHYRFKHALIQDAAYDSLLKSRRMILHRRAAEALIRAKAEPEAIARHLTAAGADDVAIDWWGRAGDDALRRSAFKEAIAHLGKAIAMADKVDAASLAADSAHPSSRRLKLHTDHGHAAMWLRGFAADEMSAAYARAREFIGAGDDAAARFISYYADCLKSFMRGEHRKALQIAETFLREAEGEGRATEAGVARRILGFVLLQMGDAAAARADLERALGEFDRERDRETLYLFGNDTEVSATNFLALTQWHLGESDAARRLIERSTVRAAQLGHAAAIASALFFRTVIESRRGDIEATRLAANSLITFTADHNLKTYADLGPIYANWACGRLSDWEEGVQGLRKALESYLELGNKSGAPSFFGLLAELEAERQNFDETLALIEQGLAMANDTGEHFTDAYLHHLRGETLLHGDPTNASSAEAAFLTAIAIARRQDARSYELISSLSLARLYQSTGLAEQALSLLTPALKGFSPTLEMPQIAEAQTLADQCRRNVRSDNSN